MKKNIKKWALFHVMCLLACTVSACDSDSPQPENPEQPVENGNTPTPGSNGRYLVVFCSRTGNTEAMAREIRNRLDCDILEVVPVTPFDDNYNTMLERARQEQAAIEQGDYPLIQSSIENMDAYDVIFVGYPIWYGHMATPMQTFLYNHGDKLKGKRIALFASSGSSGISTSVNDARSICPEAIFTETLLLTSSTIGQLSPHIAAWLQQIEVTQ